MRYAVVIEEDYGEDYGDSLLNPQTLSRGRITETAYSIPKHSHVIAGAHAPPAV
jgi:hypothetical protein